MLKEEGIQAASWPKDSLINLINQLKVPVVALNSHKLLLVQMRVDLKVVPDLQHSCQAFQMGGNIFTAFAVKFLDLSPPPPLSYHSCRIWAFSLAK